MVGVVFRLLGAPSLPRTPLAWSGRAALAVGALAVALGLVTMHTLSAGHHGAGDAPVPAAAPITMTEGHAHQADPLRAAGAVVTLQCSEACEPAGLAVLCMAVLSGLVLLGLAGRREPTHDPPPGVEAPSRLRPATPIRAGPPLLRLLCVDRT